MSVAGHTVDLVTDTGVFSPRQLDPGTEILLQNLGPGPGSAAASAVLGDIGCGYGPLAVALALTWPDAEVWAVDVNERALGLTRQNAESLGLANIRVATPDQVPADVRLAGLWSNPPIRVGKPALHDLLQEWLDRLEPEARARLVVQKHLGSDSLARWLTGEGYPTSRVTSERSYRILEVCPRAPAR